MDDLSFEQPMKAIEPASKTELKVWYLGFQKLPSQVADDQLFYHKFHIAKEAITKLIEGPGKLLKFNGLVLKFEEPCYPLDPDPFMQVIFVQQASKGITVQFYVTAKLLSDNFGVVEAMNNNRKVVKKHAEL